MSDIHKYVALSDVVDCDLGGERALLHLTSNTYFTTNQTGTALWMAMSSPQTLDDLVKVITGRFDVTDEQCRADIQILLGQMLEAKIIETLPSEAA